MRNIDDQHDSGLQTIMPDVVLKRVIKSQQFPFSPRSFLPRYGQGTAIRNDESKMQAKPTIGRAAVGVDPGSWLHGGEAAVALLHAEGAGDATQRVGDRGAGAQGAAVELTPTRKKQLLPLSGDEQRRVPRAEHPVVGRPQQRVQLPPRVGRHGDQRVSAGHIGRIPPRLGAQAGLVVERALSRVGEHAAAVGERARADQLTARRWSGLRCRTSR